MRETRSIPSIFSTLSIVAILLVFSNVVNLLNADEVDDLKHPKVPDAPPTITALPSANLTPTTDATTTTATTPTIKAEVAEIILSTTEKVATTTLGTTPNAIDTNFLASNTAVNLTSIVAPQVAVINSTEPTTTHSVSTANSTLTKANSTFAIDSNVTVTTLFESTTIENSTSAKANDVVEIIQTELSKLSEAFVTETATTQSPESDLETMKKSQCEAFLQCEREMSLAHQRCTKESRNATVSLCGLEEEFK